MVAAAAAATRSIVIDATPLQNAHAHRGIGAYVRGLFAALTLASSSSWGVLAYPGPLEEVGDRRRIQPVVPRRPRQLEFHGGWLIDELLLPVRLGRTAAFHATDPRRIPRRRPVVIATVYDLTPLHDRSVWDALWPDQRLAYRQSLKGVRSADAVIAISRTVKTDVATTLGVPTERIHVVYPALRDVVPPAAVNRDPRRLLYVGSADPHKNVDILLEALALVPSAERPTLTIVGPWHRDAVNAAGDHAARLGIDPPRIEAYVGAGRLEEHFATSSALVLPSRREGFGLPAIEAMARGVPVIAADIPVLREVTAGAARHFPVGDPAALAEEIGALLGDSADLARLSELGVRRAKAFSPTRTLGSLLAAYRSVGVELT